LLDEAPHALGHLVGVEFAREGAELRRRCGEPLLFVLRVADVERALPTVGEQPAAQIARISGCSSSMRRAMSCSGRSSSRRWASCCHRCDPFKHRKHGVGSSPRLAVALVFLLIDGVSVVEDLARDLPVVLGMLSSIGGAERAPRFWSLIAGAP